jgi:hypothetical protein
MKKRNRKRKRSFFFFFFEYKMISGVEEGNNFWYRKRCSRAVEWGGEHEPVTGEQSGRATVSLRVGPHSYLKSEHMLAKGRGQLLRAVLLLCA